MCYVDTQIHIQKGHWKRQEPYRLQMPRRTSGEINFEFAGDIVQPLHRETARGLEKWDQCWKWDAVHAVKAEAKVRVSVKAQCTQVSKISQNSELTITDYSFASILSSLHVLCLHKCVDHPFLHREKLRPQRVSNWLPGVLHYSPPRNTRQVSCFV